jgi:hydrogenase expression/formation protein HypD
VPEPVDPAEMAAEGEMATRFRHVLNRAQASSANPELARGLVRTDPRATRRSTPTLMEVCGTHTVAIARNGIRGIMPEGTRLLSGPGCPVCVTANKDIDTVIALARIPEVTITTFGDMTRVPGSTSSLLAEKAAGRSIEIVYSPLDALKYAQDHPDRQVVFVGVGFETTTPLVSMAIKRAQALRSVQLHRVRGA